MLWDQLQLTEDERKIMEARCYYPSDTLEEIVKEIEDETSELPEGIRRKILYFAIGRKIEGLLGSDAEK